MTQEELAAKLAVSAQAVSKWENDITCPDVMTLPKLAELLGITVDELLSGKKQPQKERESSEIPCAVPERSNWFGSPPG